MKIKDLIKMNIDTDVYDDVCEELAIAFVGPLSLTEEGQKKFADVLDYDVDFDNEVTIVKIDSDDWEDKLEKAKEFFHAAAGFCPEEDYKKWFNTELTLAEKKKWLTEKYKADPGTLATAISEITFDITTNLTYFFQKYDVDSRQIWAEVLNWAWEFQYDWENDPVQEDYLSWIDNFAYFKIRDLENKYEFYKMGD